MKCFSSQNINRQLEDNYKVICVYTQFSGILPNLLIIETKKKHYAYNTIRACNNTVNMPSLRCLIAKKKIFKK